MCCYILVVCLIFISGLSCFGSIEVTFMGRQYLSYSLKDNSATDNNVIRFRFKTIHPSGLILYGRGAIDFIQLELVNGVLRYSLKIGSGDANKVEAGKNLFDGEWHTVLVQRRRRITTLKVDSQSPATKILPGPRGRLDLTTYLFIGGMIDIVKKNLGVQAPQYRGCLADLRFDGIELLKGAQTAIANRPRSSLYDIYGNLPFQCQLEDLVPVTLKTPQSFIKVALPKRAYENNSFTMNFKFRTLYPYGLLFSRSALKVKMKIRLQDGTLIYEIMSYNGSKYHLVMGHRLNDGDWHDVTALISTQQISLTLDGSTISRIINMTSLLVSFSNQSRMKVFAGRGGSHSKFLGFVGCMANLKIDKESIVLKSLIKPRFAHRVDGNKCQMRDKCRPNPCLNGGRCRQDWKQFYCDCLDTFFKGLTCGLPVLKQTCEDYKGLGLDQDSHCLLHTGTSYSQDRYTALCNVTNPSRAYTVISHNLERDSMIRVVDGEILDEFTYVHKVNYHNIQSRKITALMTQSASCRQYIKFTCIKSHMLDYLNTLSNVIWTSINDHQYSTWSNVLHGNTLCSCGTRNSSTCSTGMLDSTCRCDDQDTKWIGAEGYIDIKHQLPVKIIIFSKTIATLNTSFQLGPLECWGKDSSSARKSTDRKLLKKACYPVFDFSLLQPSTKLSTTSSTTTQPCTGRSCSNVTISTDSTGPIKWTNPTTVENTARIDPRVNVQLQEGNKCQILSANSLIIILYLGVYSLFE